ncbi:phage major capsid protein [Pseudomonas paralactis]|uniref:Phage major capsid protein n=1 Tax=Pseudomonas paralactis TaxID=1615673 RepID=A0ABS0V803_9PSED|nr:phage major capsid protein [Pseudomonas paralactis]MBI6635150.1 phage major capsid protein [Pseudomonas paralactis]
MSLEILTKAVEDHGAAVKSLAGKVDGNQTKIEEALDRLQDLEMKGVKLRGGTESTSTKGAVHAFMKSSGMEAIRSGAKDTGRVELPAISIKALVSSGRGQAGDTQHATQAERGTGIADDPRLALQLLEVLTTIPVSSGSYEFTQLESFENNADYQLKEGTLKAESGVNLIEAVANIQTVAHWTRASVQVLDDEPSLQSYLGNLLGYGALAKLEAEIINGVGGTGKILGLLAQAVAFVPTVATTPTDRVGEAAAAMKAEGWRPSVVLMNPLDWFAIQTQKSTDGLYLLGGPQDPANATLWKNVVVETPSLARGKALLIDPAHVRILDRMQPTVIATRFDRDNLVTNLVTLLAELRAGLAVFAKDAIRSVDLTVTAP